jgi:hypothetical protein
MDCNRVGQFCRDEAGIRPPLAAAISKALRRTKGAIDPVVLVMHEPINRRPSKQTAA